MLHPLKDQSLHQTRGDSGCGLGDYVFELGGELFGFVFELSPSSGVGAEDGGDDGGGVGWVWWWELFGCFYECFGGEVFEVGAELVGAGDDGCFYLVGESGLFSDC